MHGGGYEERLRPPCPVPRAGLPGHSGCAEPCRAVIPSSCAGPRRLTGLRDPFPAKLLRCQPRVSRENAKQPASRPSHPPQPSSSSSAAESLPASRWSPEPPGHPSRDPPSHSGCPRPSCAPGPSAAAPRVFPPSRPLHLGRMSPSSGSVWKGTIPPPRTFQLSAEREQSQPLSSLNLLVRN